MRLRCARDRVRRDARLGHEVLLGVTASVGLLLVVVSPLAVRLGPPGRIAPASQRAYAYLRSRRPRKAPTYSHRACGRREAVLAVGPTKP